MADRVEGGSDESVTHLLALPEELLVHIAAAHLLQDDLPSALHLVSASTLLRSLLKPVGEAARQRRLSLNLTYVGEDEHARRVSLSRNVLEVAPETDCFAEAVGSLPLPASGQSSWTVCIEGCDGGTSSLGCVQIGVCDLEHRVAWSLLPYNGRLMRSRCQQAATLGDRDVPPELPDGHDTQALVDTRGRPTNLHRCAAGARITVVVDADAGTLAFGCPSVGHAPRVVLRGFAPPLRLHPWVCVPGWCGGRLRAAPYVEHAPSRARMCRSE